jgi:hypothetical protein
MLNANEYRQFFRAQVQKDLQQAEATEGKLDISLLMSPLTDEVLTGLLPKRLVNTGRQNTQRNM